MLVRSTGIMLDRYDVSKLEAEEKSLFFKSRLKEQLRAIRQDSIVSINEKWNKVRDLIKSVSEVVMGKLKRTKI